LTCSAVLGATIQCQMLATNEIYEQSLLAMMDSSRGRR
jgi:hypothetical protein